MELVWICNIAYVAAECCLAEFLKLTQGSFPYGIRTAKILDSSKYLPPTSQKYLLRWLRGGVSPIKLPPTGSDRPPTFAEALTY